MHLLPNSKTRQNQKKVCMREIIQRALPIGAAWVTAIMLSACGGGGSSDASTTTGPGSGSASVGNPWPANGYYRPVLNSSGSLLGTPSLAVSLVHPSMPTKEFVVDDVAQVATLGVYLYRGNYDAVQNSFNNVQPVTYVDATATRLRTLPLAANGAAPQPISSPGLNLCSTGSILAYNFAKPFATQIAVQTPGADGRCNTSDDEQALVTFSDAGLPSARVDAAGKRLGFFRSRTDGQPAQWLVATPKGGLSLVSILTADSTVVVPEPTTGTSPNLLPVNSTGDLLVYSQNGTLKSVNAAGSVQTHSTLTSAQGWMPLGVDSTYAFVYLNSGPAGAASTTWRILAIARADQKLYTIATGSGYIATASSSPSMLYATVVNTSAANVVKVDKYANWAKSELFAARSDAVVVVSPIGANAIMVITQGLKSSDMPSIDIRSVNSGLMLAAYGTSLPVGQDANRFDPAASIFPASSWYFASIQPGRVFGGGYISRFDVELNQTPNGKYLAQIPDGTDWGGKATDAIYASPLLIRDGFAGLSVAKAPAGKLDDASRRVYTLNTADNASALVRTTSQQR